MIARVLLAVLLLASLTAATAPATVFASDACGACPAAGGAGDDCDDDCPLCVCGPHRAPMTEPPAIPNPVFLPVAEYLIHSDSATLAPASRDILHVPRFTPVTL